MKKNSYRQPELNTWHINAQENLMFNPTSNPNLPSNPDTPGVGVKQEWDMNEDI